MSTYAKAPGIALIGGVPISFPSGKDGDAIDPGERRQSAVEEYLVVLDDAALGGDRGAQVRLACRSGFPRTGANKGLAFFAYSTNYLIDLDHAVMVDVEPSTAVRQAEVTAARIMIEWARERHDLWPERLSADSTCCSAEMLDWLVRDQDIEPHIPMIDKSQRDDGTFSRIDFTYDHAKDLYRCPGSAVLQRGPAALSPALLRAPDRSAAGRNLPLPGQQGRLRRPPDASMRPVAATDSPIAPRWLLVRPNDLNAGAVSMAPGTLGGGRPVKRNVTYRL